MSTVSKTLLELMDVLTASRVFIFGKEFATFIGDYSKDITKKVVFWS